MQCHIAIVMLVLLLSGGLARAQSTEQPLQNQAVETPVQAAAAQPPARTFETIVYPARFTPVDRLALALGALFEGEADVQVTADRESQLLLMRVTTTAKPRVLELIQQLDRQPQAAELVLILLKADQELVEPQTLSGPLPQVLDTIRELESGGQVYVSRRLELTALENQKAMLQFGQTKPVLVGTNASGFGPRSNIYQHQTIGTKLSVMHHVTEPGQLVADVSFEVSELDEVKPAEDDASPVPPGMSTFTYQATLDLQSGQARLVQQSRSQPNRQSSAVMYLVIGTTLHPPGKPADMQVRAFSSEPAPSLAAVPAKPTVPPRAEAVRPDTARPDTARPDTARPEVTRAEAVRPDTARPEVTRTEAVRPETVRPETAPGGVDGLLATEPYANVVRGYISRYDRNESGYLEKDEWDTIQGLPAEVDTDNDQRISREELLAWLSSRFRERTSPVDANVQRGSLAEYTLRRYDVDGSGALERAEWSAMVSDPSAADVNQDKIITREELIVWLQGRFRTETSRASDPPTERPRLTDEQYQNFAKTMVGRYDRNGDEKLDAKEQAAMSRQPTGADADSDGFVTISEMADWLRKQ